MAISEEVFSQFDVNGPGLPGTLFGLPFVPENSQLVILPVPWEATVSYSTGTAQGPDAILKASRQLDFFMREIHDAWKMGVCMLDVPLSLRETSDTLRILVDRYHAATDSSVVIPQKINEACETLNIYVKKLAAAAWRLLLS